MDLKSFVIPKLKFAASSGLATTVDYAVFFLLNGLGIPPVFAQLSAAFCGMLVNFFLQKRFVFNLKGRASDAFVLSLIGSLGGMLLSTLSIALLVQSPFFAKQLLLAKLLTTGFIFFYNFYLKRYIFSNNQEIIAYLKNLDSWVQQHKGLLLKGLAILAFLVGLLLVPDFGVGWDEHVQREHGLVSARYIDQKLGGALGWEDLKKDDLDEYFYRSYGVFFQLCAYSTESLLGIDDKDFHNQMLLRHYLTYFVFCIGLWSIYLLGKKRMGDWKMGLLAALLLILSPRLFPHFFSNPKDTITLSWYLLSMLTMERYLAGPNWKSAIAHAFACAILMNARPIGLIMPAATLVMLAFQYRKDLLKKLPSLGLYVVGFAAITVALWPYLWEQTWEHFSYSFDQMKRYNWDGQVLFEGTYWEPDALPWYYIPKYMLISTPLVYTLLIILGLGTALWTLPQLFSKNRPTAALRLDMMCLGLGLGPLIAVWLFNSILYDGWRQLFFIYPPLLLLGVGAFHRWRSITKSYIDKAMYRMGYAAAWGLMALALVSNLVIIIQYHPNQQAWLNFLAGNEPKLQYEMDYWGLSFKQGWEEIRDRTGTDTITVCASPWLPGKFNYDYALDSMEQKRIRFTGDPSKADYFMSIVRFEGDFSKYKNGEAPYLPGKSWFSIQEESGPLLEVFRLGNEGIKD